MVGASVSWPRHHAQIRIPSHNVSSRKLPLKKDPLLWSAYERVIMEYLCFSPQRLCRWPGCKCCSKASERCEGLRDGDGETGWWAVLLMNCTNYLRLIIYAELIFRPRICTLKSSGSCKNVGKCRWAKILLKIALRWSDGIDFVSRVPCGSGGACKISVEGSRWIWFMGW